MQFQIFQKKFFFLIFYFFEKQEWNKVSGLRWHFNQPPQLIRRTGISSLCRKVLRRSKGHGKGTCCNTVKSWKTRFAKLWFLFFSYFDQRKKVSLNWIHSALTPLHPGGYVCMFCFHLFYAKLVWSPLLLLCPFQFCQIFFFFCLV